MITRLEIDGFKSLRAFAVDLEPLKVFIGPNSAGKSNLLDALALLSRLSSMAIDDAFKQGRGRAIDQFTRSGGEPGTTIRFAVEVFVPGPEGAEAELIECPDRYRYELTIERSALPSGAERLSISHERLSFLDAVGAQEIFKQVGAKASQCRLALNRISNPEHRFYRKLGTESERDELTRVGDELSSYRLVHLDSARLKEPSERIGSDVLAPDASNLPTVLANLPGPSLGEIRADLVSLVPGVSSFDIVPDGDSFRIDFEFSGGERLPARLVSDGTLRILALLTALRVEPRPVVIGIEEPENGVYPGRLRKLLDYMQEIAAQGGEQSASPTQLILTTHSPVVLAALRARPELLRFVDLVRRDGQLATRARTVNPTPGPDRGRLSISLREIDELLHAADSEIGQ